MHATRQHWSLLIGEFLALLIIVAVVVAGVWLIGAFAILFGVLTIALGFRLKGVKDRLARRPA